MMRKSQSVSKSSVFVSKVSLFKVSKKVAKHVEFVDST